MRSTAKRFDWGWKARLSGLPGWLLVAANRDFCPCAERYVGWLRQPLGWLVIAAAASLLLGLTLGSQGLVMFAVIAAFVAMGVLWPWVTMRGITSEVRFRRSPSPGGRTGRGGTLGDEPLAVACRRLDVGAGVP